MCPQSGPCKAISRLNYLTPRVKRERRPEGLPRFLKSGKSRLEDQPPTRYSAIVSGLTATQIDEIKSAPEPVQREVLDFLAFLKARHASADQAGDDLLPLAQTVWAADWETPQEDAAWRDL
jgi:hypothetical protein